MRHILICGLLGSTFFFTLTHKRQNFRGKIFLNIKCVFRFSLQTCLKCFQYRNNSARYRHKCTYVFMYITCCSCQILTKLEFSRQIFEKKNTEITNFKKIRPKAAKLFRAGGRTDGQTDTQADIPKLILAFRNFANVPTN